MVLVMVMAGTGCQLHEHLAAVLAMAVEQFALLAHLGQSLGQDVLAVLQQREHLAHDLLLKQALLLGEDALTEQVLQLNQLTAFEQVLVAANFGQQGLLC